MLQKGMADERSRPETGNMRFGDDRTGVFIRGDQAEFFVTVLDSLITRADVLPLSHSALQALRDILAGSGENTLQAPPAAQMAQLMAEHGQVIDSFTGEYGFLSNFHIEPDRTHVEGEYQAAKCVNPADRQRFAGKSPAQAKRIGRRVQIRKEWNNIRLGVMLDLLRRKYRDHDILGAKLVATWPAKLIEGNYWGDQFWGQFQGKGENWLGVLLMQVREELMAERQNS